MKPDFLYSGFPISNFINFLLDNVGMEKCHKLFFRSLSRDVEENFYNVSYLTDLGLRRAQEPRNYFLTNAKRAIEGMELDLVPVIKSYDFISSELYSTLGITNLGKVRYDFSPFVIRNLNSPEIINRTVKYYVDVLGSWEDAESIAESVFSNLSRLLHNEQSAYLISNCGNVLASAGDERCKKFYLDASSMFQDPYQRFSTIFRIAVFDIKKKGTKEDIDSSLYRAYKASEQFGSQTENKYNSFFCVGVVKNLEALYLLKQGKNDDVEKTILEAWDIVSNIPLEKLDIEIGVTSRYKIQILENLALFNGISEKWNEAIRIFRDAVDLCKNSNLDFLNESLALLGYALIRVNKYEEAIECLLESEKLFDNTVLIDKTKQVRKMLAVAYDGIGKKEESEIWIEKIS